MQSNYNHKALEISNYLKHGNTQRVHVIAYQRFLVKLYSETL